MALPMPTQRSGPRITEARPPLTEMLHVRDDRECSASNLIADRDDRERRQDPREGDETVRER